MKNLSEKGTREQQSHERLPSAGVVEAALPLVFRLLSTAMLDCS